MTGWRGKYAELIISYVVTSQRVSHERPSIDTIPKQTSSWTPRRVKHDSPASELVTDFSSSDSICRWTRL